MTKRAILALMAIFATFALLAPTATAAAPKGPVLPEGAELIEVTERSPLPIPPGTYISIDNYFYFRNAWTGKCLGVAGASGSNGAAILQWTCDWQAPSDQRMHTLKRGSIWHHIDPFHSSGKCLGVGGASMNPAASLVQWTCSPNANEQLYAFRVVNPDQSLSRVEIFVLHSHQAIGVAGGSTANGASVVQFPWQGGSNYCTGDQCWDMILN
jgi:hypothetical protein